MKWIGITGSIGTGKSTVANLLRIQGFTVLDADEIAKNQLEKDSEGYKAVINIFGDQILTETRDIDKSKLSQIVFNDKIKLTQLEKALHPLVQKEVVKHKDRALKQGTKLLFYDVPLLFEKNLQHQFDEVILISASEKNQFERIRKRNNWSEDEIKNRLANQISLQDKKKFCHLIIENNGDMDDLKNQVLQVIRALS